jgi:Tol biopolymer transport system component
MTFRILPVLFLTASVATSAPAKRFTLEQIMSAPFPTALTAAPKGGAVAWVLNQQGSRNIWVAEAPDYKGRQLTSYRADDGQEIDEIVWTPDGRSLIFVRGGDFEMHRDNPNPSSLPQGVEQDIWIVALSGGAPRKLAEGSAPAISPKGGRIAYLKKGEVWTVALDENAKPAQMLHAKGQADELHWSPDGSRLAFSTNRTDHAFIAVYNADSPGLTYLSPSVDRDSNPVWSPDSKQVAFLRTAANTRAFSFGPVRTAQPWSIHLADAATGTGRELWHADEGPGSAFHAMVASDQLLWGAGDRIVFPWEKTGFQHLYSISTHGDAPTPLNVSANSKSNTSRSPPTAAPSCFLRIKTIPIAAISGASRCREKTSRR